MQAAAPLEPTIWPWASRVRVANLGALPANVVPAALAPTRTSSCDERAANVVPVHPINWSWLYDDFAISDPNRIRFVGIRRVDESKLLSFCEFQKQVSAVLSLGASHYLP
jgi:hypothetical protein